MEVRCEKCHKLFRVPDEKISAKGIKFVCTRCGEYVIISREEFEQSQPPNADPIVPGRPETESDAVRLQQPQREKPGSNTPSFQIRPTVAAVPAHVPEPAQAPNIEPMEVRCKNCKKLFRVPGNKISGTGIKFICTRCGEYVTVTREEFDLYLQEKNNVFPPDIAQSTPQRAEQAVTQNEEQQAYKDPFLTAIQKEQVIPFPETLQAASESPPPAVPEPVQSRKTEHVLETAPAVEPPSRSEAIPVPQVEPRIDFTFEPQSEPEQEVKLETHSEPAPEYRLEPVRALKPEQQIDFTFDPQSEPEQEAKLETHIEPAPESRLGPVQAPKPELKINFTFDPQPEPEQEAKPETHVEPGPRPQPEPVQAPKTEPKIGPAREHQPEPTPVQVPTPAIQSKTERRIVREPTPEALRTAAPVARPSEPPKQIPMPEKVYSRPAPSPAERAVQETVLLRLGRPALLVIAMVALISLAGYGMLTFFKSSSRNVREAHDLALVEGMLITSVTGSMDASGDVLINGVIQNTEQKEKNAWIVVVEMYDKQGALLNKIRLVRGKQIYTGRDYDVLARRGVNVQALKEKSLDEQGIIISPKGTVTFEARYIQPPEEFASFKALLQPFDPVRRFREISDDVK